MKNLTFDIYKAEISKIGSVIMVWLNNNIKQQDVPC